MSTPDGDPLADLLNELREDPVQLLEKLRLAERAIGMAENLRKYRFLALLCSCMYQVNSDDQLQDRLFEYARKKINTRGSRAAQLPRLLARVVVGAVEAKGALYEQARTYGHIVSYYVNKSLDAHAIFEDLKAKTIYGVIDLIEAEKENDDTFEPRPERSRDRSTNSGRGDEIEHDDHRSELTHGDDVDASRRRGVSAQAKNVSQAAEGAVQARASRRGCSPFDVKRDLVVEAVPYIDRLCSLSVGEEVSIVLRRLENDGDWARFEIAELRGILPNLNRVD